MEVKCYHVVDVHTHLTDNLMIKDIDNVINRALQQKVLAALVVAENKADFQPVIDLHYQYPNFVLPCLGIHPIQGSGKKDEKGIEVKRSVCVDDYEGVEDIIDKYKDILGAIGELISSMLRKGGC
ncbi:putative deoxyribonuclease tatdn3 [Bulinus truncatus]|nr:putative deoxyribonuclease tatdn3 [Bulinus truncatus]